MSKKNSRYFWYFLLDNYGEFYDDGQRRTELSYLDTSYPMNYEHFILLNYGCFQIKYTNYSRKYNIDIRDNDVFMIANTNTYNFIYIRDGSKKNINLTISSSKNNFINALKINNILQTLEVKNNGGENFNYFYNIIFSTYISEIKMDINFNYDFLFIDFQIKEYIPPKENKENNGLSTFGIIVIIVSALLIGIPLIISCLNKFNDFREKRKYRNECQLIENFYDLIRQDCEEINKVCLICFRNEKKMPILNENDDDNKINFPKYDYNFNVYKNYIIDDINNGIFISLLDYITPKKCEHLYHEKCGNFKRKKDCLFCQLLITSKNIKNFGLFISRREFNDLLKKKNFSKSKIEKMNEENFNKIKGIFYSKIEKEKYNINNKMLLDNIMKIKSLNEKYAKVYYKNSFKYYDLYIRDEYPITKIEKELNDEIEKKEEERRRQIEREEQRREEQIELNERYNDDDDDDNDNDNDGYYNRYNDYNYNYNSNRINSNNNYNGNKNNINNRNNNSNRNNNRQNSFKKSEKVKVIKCSSCQSKNKCPLCGGNMSSNYPIGNLYAHSDCYEDRTCCICHKKGPGSQVSSACTNCRKNGNAKGLSAGRCFICRKLL